MQAGQHTCYHVWRAKNHGRDRDHTVTADKTANYSGVAFYVYACACTCTYINKMSTFVRLCLYACTLPREFVFMHVRKRAYIQSYIDGCKSTRNVYRYKKAIRIHNGHRILCLFIHHSHAHTLTQMHIHILSHRCTYTYSLTQIHIHILSHRYTYTWLISICVSRVPFLERRYMQIPVYCINRSLWEHLSENMSQLHVWMPRQSVYSKRWFLMTVRKPKKT